MAAQRERVKPAYDSLVEPAASAEAVWMPKLCDTRQPRVDRVGHPLATQNHATTLSLGTGEETARSMVSATGTVHLDERAHRLGAA